MLSIDGSIPRIPGWEEPGGDLSGHQVALIDATNNATAEGKQAATSAKLAGYGADVRTVKRGASTLADALLESYAWFRP